MANQGQSNSNDQRRHQRRHMGTFHARHTPTTAHDSLLSWTHMPTRAPHDQVYIGGLPKKLISADDIECAVEGAEDTAEMRDAAECRRDARCTAAMRDTSEM